MKIKIKIFGLLLACITCLMHAQKDIKAPSSYDEYAWTVEKMAEEYERYVISGKMIGDNSARDAMRKQLLIWLCKEANTARELEYKVFSRRKLPCCDVSLKELFEWLSTAGYNGLILTLVSKTDVDGVQQRLKKNEVGYCSNREMFLKDNNKRTVADVAFDWRNCKEETKEAAAKEIGVAIYNCLYTARDLEIELLRYKDGKQFVLDLATRIDTDKRAGLGLEFSFGVNYDRTDFDRNLNFIVTRSVSYWNALYYNMSVLPQFVAGILLGNLAHDGFYKPSSCTKTRCALTTGIGLIIAGIGHEVKYGCSDNFLYADGSTKSKNLIKVERHMAPAGLFGFALGALGSMVAKCYLCKTKYSRYRTSASACKI